MLTYSEMVFPLVLSLQNLYIMSQGHLFQMFVIMLSFMSGGVKKEMFCTICLVVSRKKCSVPFMSGCVKKEVLCNIYV